MQTNLILTGPGRSGTTFFAHLLSKSNHVCGNSQWDFYFHNPYLSGLAWRFKSLLPGKLSPRIIEDYTYWNKYAKKFGINTEFESDQILDCRRYLSTLIRMSNKTHYTRCYFRTQKIQCNSINWMCCHITWV